MPYAIREDQRGWRAIASVDDLLPGEVFSDSEPAAPVGEVPNVVTMRQARLALLQLDKLAEVEALIAQLGTAAQIEWEYAQTIERDHPLVAQFAAHEVDAFFQLAATL